MKGERKKPGPKPGFKRAAAAAVASTAIAAAAASSAQPVAPDPPPEPDPRPEPEARPATQTRFPDPLQRHRDIDSMPEAELRAYARQIGMTPRDANTLSVERLRYNAKHHVIALIEDL